MSQCNKLTVLQVKNAKPKSKEYHLSDGKGLFLRVYPNGTKSYILIQYIGKKQVKQSLGYASEITLENARKLAEQIKANQKEFCNNNVPSTISFKDAFDEYLSFKIQGLSDSSKKLLKVYAKYFNKLNDIPLAQMKRKDILNAFEYMLLNNQQSNFAQARSFLSVFFGWAIQKEYCEHNIARDIELKYLFARKSVKHHAHFSDLNEIITLKKEVENCGSRYVSKLLFLFQLYTAVRPSEARLATWDEIDLEKGIWRIPASRMKMRKIHEVALSKQLIKALKEYKKNTSAEGYCFKNLRGNKLGKSTLLAMIQYIGYQYKINIHGLRGTFATIANNLRDEHGFSNDIIQACLAHETQNQVASAYNHAEYKKERAKILQWWADKLGDIDLKVLKNTSRYS